MKLFLIDDIDLSYLEHLSKQDGVDDYDRRRLAGIVFRAKQLEIDPKTKVASLPIKEG